MSGHDFGEQRLESAERFFQAANRFTPEFCFLDISPTVWRTTFFRRVAAGAAQEFLVLREKCIAFGFEMA